MQPYLLLYCISHYSLLEYRRNEAEQVLNKKLINFYKFNPLFGRKKYKIEVVQCENFKKKITGKTIVYDDRHILFNNVEQQNIYFLTDHLKCTGNPLSIIPIDFNNNNNNNIIRVYGSDSDTSEGDRDNDDDNIYEEDDEVIEQDGDYIEENIEENDYDIEESNENDSIS